MAVLRPHLITIFVAFYITNGFSYYEKQNEKFFRNGSLAAK